ncbi:GNAT family N-acetyltransferase [Novosphingobium sp. YJ-S2-02]|uniref:GNAT family N-acetyltransferase n=1 Tax=Novosphingobium aureum TaxID=2792964 RepID=A0A931MK58_9SPHN|nr:GNAT family N-acetyltransferase [Novosphingobium aureum]MBH0112552.1 GNAT family N-acetyltransferase [Novosphingobium aureum]
MIDDLDKIMTVMETAFDPQYGEAWTRRQVEDSLNFPHTHYSLVAADGTFPAENVHAAGFWMSRSGFGEEELLLLAVSPQYRRNGLGLILLESFASAARTRNNERLLLEMRRGNPAESLYRGFGFLPVGLRKAYYATTGGERIDAITFARDIT